MSGAAGNDTMVGGDGADTMSGGVGVDSLTAATADVLYGGTGNDSLTFGADATANAYGGTGDDYILATGAGNSSTASYSFIYGNDGNDTILSGLLGDGQITAYGGAGNDLISGSDATFDVLYGGDGADTIYAIGTGTDTIYGDSGADVLYTGASLGTVYGGEGNDTIYFGGSGELFTTGTVNAIMSGGEGADEFSFANNVGSGYADTFTAAHVSSASFATIADFSRGTDVISLYSLFATGVSPSVINQDLTLASNNSISWTTSGGDTKVAIIGDADEYLFLNLTGVTTLALTDFEIL
jgi:Ca2+-binding RTX toxin-like protein